MSRSVVEWQDSGPGDFALPPLAREIAVVTCDTRKEIEDDKIGS
jgi:hypothetical protein